MTWRLPERIGTKVWSTCSPIVRSDSSISRAQSVRQTVWEYDARSRAAKDFAKLAEYLLPAGEMAMTENARLDQWSRWRNKLNSNGEPWGATKQEVPQCSTSWWLRHPGTWPPRYPGSQETRTETQTVYLYPDLYKWIRHYATDTDQEISDVVNEALKQYKAAQETVNTEQ